MDGLGFAGRRLGADDDDERAGAIAADAQAGAEGVARDRLAGCRAVLGVELAGLGEELLREYWGHAGRWLALGLLWRSRGADGVDLAQHPGADLAPADEQRRADRVD